ncbi:MAG TPA: asparagine synthase (glutamine-hydrolyzing) [Candidatus Thermoplasmatota archaeon]|nr:asparagine synthase (glutamine-hydrolyzing) [Candidatus Thermoplasmatota archaeon]
MCGIAGLLGRDDRALVGRMCARLAHRGPDGSALWSDAQVTLGHLRLAVIDVATGQQPMADASGRFTIVYNGEVYNHLALRAELEALGARFRTRSDTEAILEGYRLWGTKVLERLEGMFALALWDGERRELLLARDPWGIKPLHYAFAFSGGLREGGDLLFASEAKALFAHEALPPRPDLDAFREQAVLEFLTGTRTLFAGVHQLPPSTWALVRPGDRRVTPHAYAAVSPEAAPTTSEEAVRAVRERLGQAVREQLASEVPLGVVLSGGLDSAAVAALHQSMSDRPVQTFTVAEGEEVEDLRVARRVADHLGTEHHEATFGLDDLLRDLPLHAWHNENVNYTEFFFLPPFRAMRRKATVGLCGQGADELWGGYARYQDPHALAAERLRRLEVAKPEDPALAGTILRHHASGAELAAWDQGAQLANFQLRLVDRGSMAFGLEVRVPFLSRPQQALSDAVPWEWKVQGGIEKWVLRRAVEPLLPKEVAWRRKVPAGRATAPRVMERFEAQAARLRPRAHPHPAGELASGADRLMYALWTELFVHDARPQSVTLEALA